MLRIVWTVCISKEEVLRELEAKKTYVESEIVFIFFVHIRKVDISNDISNAEETGRGSEPYSRQACVSG